MRDPFATALDALFSAPGSVAAVYVTASDGLPTAVRTIRDQASEDMPIGSRSVPVDANLLLIRRSEVARPATGDTIITGTFADVAIDDPAFNIVGEPSLDVEGLTWSCEMIPADV